MDPHVALPTLEVGIPAGGARLAGDLAVPHGARGIVLFAHGSGSSRKSSRNVEVAQTLQQVGLATLLFDLLTPDEERVDLHTRQYRFDIPRLASRLVAASEWLRSNDNVRDLPIGYFGASTGSAAAIIAAAELGTRVSAVVSRGGRPDLADDATLARVTAPTLLIVGGHDDLVIGLNQQAFRHLTCEKELVIVPGATHLFEEPGTLAEVARLAAAWFDRHVER
ncbi:MAG TPA: alpha/beta family hydrolase [Casimicrobiaceae bacterium]|nr:alpha/beta family hydrolase [Casimicrobiaceae bacterium]